MPRYFFDTDNGKNLFVDFDGIEFEDFAAAKDAAQKTLPDMARESLNGSTHRSYAISVRDEAGSVVLRMAINMVVEEGDNSV